MIEATSCGGVVIFRGKILLLYKSYKNKYEGWVLPKGTVEAGEEYKDTAAREVLEETGVDASIIKYVGKSQYTFNVPEFPPAECSSENNRQADWPAYPDNDHATDALPYRLVY